MIKTVDTPYPGTLPFRQIDHTRFYGRAKDALILADSWRFNQLTFAVGQVASGKTSLLNAGVFPLIAGKRADVLPVGRLSYGSTFPFAALPEHNPYTLSLLRSWSPGETSGTATRMAGWTVRDFVRQRAGMREVPILAAIDQSEELLATSPPRSTYRRQFLDEIAEAIRHEPRLHLLVVVREDAVGSITDVLGAGFSHCVKPLTRQHAIEAVAGPAAGTSRPYEPEAAETIVTDLQTSTIRGSDGYERHAVSKDVQPALLQIVCARLWEWMPADAGPITVQDARDYGSVDSALAAHYGKVIAAVASEHGLSTRRLHSWLLDTFVTEHGTLGTAYEGPNGTANMSNAVVRALQDRHLLAATRRSGLRWYELLSERLVEPLRAATYERPSQAEPSESLRAAERALTLGELDAAELYAKEILQAKRRSDPRLQAEAVSLLGNLAHEREKPVEAEDRYRGAARRFEELRDTKAVGRQLAAVGQTLAAQGRYAEAVSELRSAVDRVPNDLVVRTGLGLALWRLGEGRTGAAVLTDVLGIDGGNPEALRARGEIFADLGRARDALADLDRVPLDGWPSARAARGLALAELGQQDASNREIEHALEKAPDNGVVLLFAARASELQGEKAAVYELARRAVNAADPALAPEHLEQARRLLASGQLSAPDAGYGDPPESLDAVV
jgi:tetratricopeptide (TPR) repeat protein